jgi:large subunit ribosomal protein L5
MSRLYERYKKEIIPSLMKELGYKNFLAVPHVEKVVLNVGLGEAVSDPSLIEKTIKWLSLITGQKGVPTLARKSISDFKLRENQPIGVKVTLRGKRMYDFLEKLINIVLPRTRDFRGVSEKSFDRKGNFTFGFSEQLVFPEIEYGEIDRVRGLEVTIVTTAQNQKEAKRLLEFLGMPFRKVKTEN